ncbi:MAG TPA: DUF3857 domain-containing protein, partial [Sphingobacterium sp.]|nr:DUF3857 domain-containing protein [Sphingobacterium sp.]
MTPTWVRQVVQSPKELDLDDISAGYYFESVEYQVHLANQQRYYKSTKVLFDNNGTENAGQLYVSFDPKYQKLILHELKVIRDGKEINKLDVKAFKVLATETELSRFIYNGAYSAYCVLDDLRKDDKVVFAYSLQGFNPVFENKFFDNYYLQGYEPIGHLYVNYVIPKSRSIRFRCHNDAPEPHVSETDGVLHYTWEIAGTEKREYIDYEPYWASEMQWVECSEFESWKDVAKWATDTNPVTAIKPGSSLYSFIEKNWQIAGGDHYKFLQQVTDFVQNEIRYMAVSTGEHSHRANQPTKVFDQRYGDCKDKSVLLGSILATKGISSSIVLVNTYKEYGLDKQLPSPTAFDHMVLCVDIHGRKQYLDPTITNQGGDIKSRYFPYYGNVLDVDESKILIQVGRDEHSKVVITETYELEGGRKATLTVHTTYYEGSADEIRQYFKDNAKNQIQKSYLDYYSRIHNKVAKKESLSFADDIEANIFRVTEVYEIKDIGVLDDNVGKNYIPLYANHINEKLPLVNEVRFEPIALEFPVNVEYDINIVNKNGNRIQSSRENVFYDREAYLFSKNVTSTDDTLKIKFRLIHHDTYVPTKDVDRYVSDFATRDNIFSCGYFINNDGYLLGSFGDTAAGGVTWPLSLFIFLVFVFAIYLVGYNGKTPSSIISLYTEASYDKIGGWLIVLLIAMILSVLRLLGGLVGSNSIFALEVWNAHTGMVGVSALAYRSLIIYETVFNALILVLLVY